MPKPTLLDLLQAELPELPTDPDELRLFLVESRARARSRSRRQSRGAFRAAHAAVRHLAVHTAHNLEPSLDEQPALLRAELLNTAWGGGSTPQS